MTKKRRAERLAVKRSTPQKKTPTWMWLAGGGVVAILLVIGLFYLGNQGLVNAGSGIDGVEILADQGRGHQDGDIAYVDDVPVGGVHNPSWQNCGIYNEPVRTENAVHSLEHGAVWIAYRSNLAEDQVETLRELVRQERRNRGEALVLLSPKADIQNPIVVAAWRARLRLDNASDERLTEFVRYYQRGPFTPELQANCVNGIGTPSS